MEFAYVVRPAFDRRYLADANQRQRGVVEEHAAWLQARYAEGRVRFAGRCDDGPFALVVLDAETEKEARELMQQDPSVRSGLQRAEFYPFRIVLAREREP